MMEDYKKILIIRTDKMGDVILSTPVIKVLRDKYPKSYIAFMVRPYTKEIVRGNPYLDEVVIYDKYGKHKNFFSTLKFAWYLRKKKFDVAFILHPTNRVHLITFLAGIPERIGYDKKLGFLLTKKIKDLKILGERHELEYNFDILKAAGIKEASDELFMPLSECDRITISSLLSKKGITEDDKIIAIHPSASCPSRIWPAERFKEVCSRLIMKNSKIKVALISSGEHEAICRQVAESLNENNYVIFSSLTLKELAALLEKSELLISNDSGPVHIAASVGVPVVVIFGRNEAGLSPRRWHPRGEKNIILHKKVGCNKCLAHRCQLGFKCLKAITVKEVLDAAEKIQKNISC